MGGKFHFREPENAGVFVCAHVWDEQQPILYVSHDGDGDWQFLCGGIHEGLEPKLVSLAHVVSRDPSVNELAELRCNHTAERDEVGGEWQIVDEGDAKLRADIAEYGWHIVGVRGDDEGPAFSYSVGMAETLDHPEIIMFGLPSGMMGALINDLGAMIEAGRAPVPGEPVEDLLEGEYCILRAVTAENRREYLRYACRYYEGRSFEALQCFWPSKSGRFPWDPGAHPEYVSLQPDLSDSD